MTHLVAFCIGTGMTLGLALITGPGEASTVTPPPPPTQAPRTEVRITRALPGVSPSTLADLEALEDELEICLFERRLLEGRLRIHEGEYQDWPAEVEDRFQPAALEDALIDAVEPSGLAEVAMLDCDEFPCVAVIEASDPDQPCCIGLQRLLKDMEGYEDAGRPSISGVIDGRPVLVVALQPPGDAGEQVNDRLGYRLTETYEALQAEVDGY